MNFIRVEKVDAYFDSETNEFLILDDKKETRVEKDNFHREYKSIVDNMTFSEALHLLKSGYNITRKRWDNDHLYLVVMHSPRPIEFLDGLMAHDSYIAIRTKQNTLSPYQPSNDDLMADDWVIIT